MKDGVVCQEGKIGVTHEVSRLPTRGKSDGAAIGYMPMDRQEIYDAMGKENRARQRAY
jgi:hypothetical protein